MIVLKMSRRTNQQCQMIANKFYDRCPSPHSCPSSLSSYNYTSLSQLPSTLFSHSIALIFLPAPLSSHAFNLPQSTSLITLPSLHLPHFSTLNTLFEFHRPYFSSLIFLPSSLSSHSTSLSHILALFSSYSANLMLLPHHSPRIPRASFSSLINLLVFRKPLVTS